MDTASKQTLEDEFGTSRDDDVVTQILEKGSIVASEVSRDVQCLPNIEANIERRILPVEGIPT